MEKRLKQIIVTVCKWFHISITDTLVDAFVQFVKFGIVGVSNTLISYVINILVLLGLRNFHVHWDYVAGNLVAFFLSVLWSFYWNNKYVFVLEEGENRSIGKALLKTYISYSLTGILLTNILSYVWVDILDISKYIAPLINLIVSVPLNFVINKFWAFKA